VDKEKYIKRFKTLYKRKTGKNISDGVALARFEKLTALVKAVYVPIKKAEFNNCIKKLYGKKY